MGKASRRRGDRQHREARQREVEEARVKAHEEAGWPIGDLVEQRGLARVTVELVDGPTLTGVLSAVQLQTEFEGVIISADLSKPPPEEA